ncbi:hypothetical protein HHK36_026956 [Tetracentron sinense]|uniref:Auxin-responsive protein n=1 Tax=Tetracentron sinense TaxID=13715 RepID=A0A834YKJ9_TETSI|nr:hypothetical protein HHK36_026956 [Tetracentron sinense]
MEGVLGLLFSRSSTNGLVLNTEVVEQDYVGLTSEVSSYPDEAELELGLGLSFGGVLKAKPCTLGEYVRILTANDFPLIVSGGSFPFSSSSSGRVNASVGGVVGAKRAADSAAQEVGSALGGSQVVGWPPIRAYRINNLVNQTKAQVAKDDDIVIENSKDKDTMKEITCNRSNKTSGNVKEKQRIGFVKVIMDGVPIGRKVDRNAHACYETLAQTLEDMFPRPTTTINAIWFGGEEHGVLVDETKSYKLLDGSSRLQGFKKGMSPLPCLRLLTENDDRFSSFLEKGDILQPSKILSFVVVIALIEGKKNIVKDVHLRVASILMESKCNGSLPPLENQTV